MFDQSVIAQVAAHLGVSGILAWYLWYTVSKLIPRMNEENNASHERLMAVNRESMEAFRADLKEEREVRVKEREMLAKMVKLATDENS